MIGSHGLSRLNFILDLEGGDPRPGPSVGGRMVVAMVEGPIRMEVRWMVEESEKSCACHGKSWIQKTAWIQDQGPRGEMSEWSSDHRSEWRLDGWNDDQTVCIAHKEAAGITIGTKLESQLAFTGGGGSLCG